MAYRNDEGRTNNRLFIICGKGVSEQAFREAFSQYGTIEDIWIVKDRRTSEDRGIVYITFSKASEAALAMEELNGRNIPNHPKPLKIVIANSKRDGSTRDPREDEKLVRLFVIIPKTFSDADLKKEFQQFGDVESVTILRDKSSGESKGFGYVKFHRPYHAALAFETCDPSFKPKFAEPQRPRAERDHSDDMFFSHPDPFNKGMKRPLDEAEYYSGGFGNDSGPFGGGYSAFSVPQPPPPNVGSPMGDQQGPMELLQNYPHTTATRLHITAPIGLTQQYLTRLFNLVPGLEYCDLNETTGIAYARYSTPQCAAYARDHLDGFEYPIGACLLVKYDENQLQGGNDMNPAAAVGYNMSMPGMTGESQDMRQKHNFNSTAPGAKKVTAPLHGGNFPSHPGQPSPALPFQAAILLEKAGINPQTILNSEPHRERVSYCNISLPMPQPLKPEDTGVAQRLFIVCQPAAVSERILRDAFCRFGNLIDVYLLTGRNYGYAKYASKESALKAIQLLHGQNLAGQRIKVLEAEPPKGQPSDSSDGPAKKARI